MNNLKDLLYSLNYLKDEINSTLSFRFEEMREKGESAFDCLGVSEKIRDVVYENDPELIDKIDEIMFKMESVCQDIEWLGVHAGRIEKYPRSKEYHFHIGDGWSWDDVTFGDKDEAIEYALTAWKYSFDFERDNYGPFAVTEVEQPLDDYDEDLEENEILTSKDFYLYSDYSIVRALLDDEIVERIKRELNPSTKIEFMHHCLEAHYYKYGPYHNKIDTESISRYKDWAFETDIEYECSTAKIVKALIKLYKETGQNIEEIESRDVQRDLYIGNIKVLTWRDKEALLGYGKKNVAIYTDTTTLLSKDDLDELLKVEDELVNTDQCRALAEKVMANDMYDDIVGTLDEDEFEATCEGYDELEQIENYIYYYAKRYGKYPDIDFPE